MGPPAAPAFFPKEHHFRPRRVDDGGDFECSHSVPLNGIMRRYPRLQTDDRKNHGRKTFLKRAEKPPATKQPVIHSPFMFRFATMSE